MPDLNKSEIGKFSNGMKTVEPYTPIQYLIGKTEFFGLDFVVNDDVFIPRPETEVLVESVIEIVHRTSYIVHRDEVRTTKYERRILDLCTGSGNIAISLSFGLARDNPEPAEPFDKCSGFDPEHSRRIEALTKNITDCKIIASDISDKALEVARRNATLNGISEKIEFLKSDLFENIIGKSDIIVSNPPYVARYEFKDLQKEVLMEPRIALDGGEDGLDFYRRIVSQAPNFLNNGGYLVMEIGFGQLNFIKRIIKDTKGFKVSEIEKDQNGIERVIVARWIN